MRINANSFSTAAFNIKSQNKIHTTSPKKEEQSVNINPEKAEGNKNAKGNSLQNILKSISERKQNIVESKNELIDKTLENGGKLSDIAEPLRMYEAQLKNLDKERQAAIAKDLEKSKADKKIEKPEQLENTQEPKTEEEAQLEKVNKTAEKVARFDTVEGSLSMAESMKSRIKILEGEIKMNSAFRGDFEAEILKTATSHISMPVDLGSSSKEKEIAKLNEKIKEITENAGSIAAKVNKEIAQEIAQEIKADTGKKVIVKTEEEETAKAENQVQGEEDANGKIDTYA